MKILKDNYNNIKETYQINPYPRNLICENCGSEIEYEKSDLRMGVYGCVHLDCPLCGYSNMLDENEESIILTVDNIEFPVHFHHTSTETGAVDCCTNEMVKEYIRKAVDYFRENKDEYDWGSHITGNLYIHVYKYSGDEEYTIVVSNDFYETSVPFGEEDY